VALRSHDEKRRQRLRADVVDVSDDLVRGTGSPGLVPMRARIDAVYKSVGPTAGWSTSTALPRLAPVARPGGQNRGRFQFRADPFVRGGKTTFRLSAFPAGRPSLRWLRPFDPLLSILARSTKGWIWFAGLQHEAAFDDATPDSRSSAQLWIWRLTCTLNLRDLIGAGPTVPHNDRPGNLLRQTIAV
jgi:hypothetical protein